MTTAIYPNVPGYKVAGPSENAAAAVREDAETLRAAVLEQLRRDGPMTADECAARLQQSILSVRPRFSELRTLGRLTDSGDRRKNSSGHSATVWRLSGTLVQPALI